MLSRLKNAVLTLDGSPSSAEDGGMVSVPEDEVMVLDMQSLRACIPVPGTGTWRLVAGMCGKVISPVYRGIHGMLAEDIEKVAEVLSQVGLDAHDDAGSTPGCCASLPNSESMSHATCPIPEAPNQLFPERPRRKRRRSSNVEHNLPLIIPSTHPSTPIIIITPCPQQPLLTSGHVPYQDDAHGLKLTVPSHPVFNSVFPPLVPLPYMLPPIGSWNWLDGHWQAVLPDLKEQAKKGMYSRAVTVKSKPCRRPSRARNSV